MPFKLAQRVFKMKKRTNHEKKSREKITCPMCSAVTRPVPLENGEILCPACRTDLKPYIEAYLEYVKVRAEQNGMEFNHDI